MQTFGEGEEDHLLNSFLAAVLDFEQQPFGDAQGFLKLRLIPRN